MTSGLDISSSNESFLLGVTSYRDLHLFSVQHQSTLHDGGEEGGEGDGEGEGERSNSVALLVTKQLCSMSKRQITSILSKAQLGKEYMYIVYVCVLFAYLCYLLSLSSFLPPPLSLYLCLLSVSPPSPLLLSPSLSLSLSLFSPSSPSLLLSLGSSLDTLIVLGSSNGDIILQANTHALVRLTLHSSSTQQLSMSLSSVFSIEPNMESFQYDESLPQYVGKVNDVVCKWPLLFTLTEDGIVRIL